MRKKKKKKREEVRKFILTKVFKSIRTAILGEANRQFNPVYQLHYNHVRDIFKHKKAATEVCFPI